MSGTKGRTTEQRRNNAAAHGGKPFIDAQGNSYFTIPEAAEATGLSRSTIRNALKKRTKSTKGNLFYYVDEPPPVYDPAVTEKACSKCKIVKPRSEFGVRNINKNKLLSQCKPCTRQTNWEYEQRHPGRVKQRRTDWNAANADKKRAHSRKWYKDHPEAQLKKSLRAFGLTPEEFVKRLDEQEHKCAICRSSDPGSNRRFRVDHDHDTGKVRGLLCHKCNVALGLFSDSVQVMKTAINYLEASR